MKDIKLQLVTVNLENGDTGTFVGIPLVTDETHEADCQVEGIWFSDTQTLPDNMTVAQLIRLVQQQLCHCNSLVQ